MPILKRFWTPSLRSCAVQISREALQASYLLAAENQDTDGDVRFAPERNWRANGHRQSVHGHSARRPRVAVVVHPFQRTADRLGVPVKVKDVDGHDVYLI